MKEGGQCGHSEDLLYAECLSGVGRTINVLGHFQHCMGLRAAFSKLLSGIRNTFFPIWSSRWASSPGDTSRLPCELLRGRQEVSALLTLGNWRESVSAVYAANVVVMCYRLRNVWAHTGREESEMLLLILWSPWHPQSSVTGEMS